MEVLFNLLQEGGRTKHENIAAEDKDFEPFMKKICKFATTDLFAFANDIVSIECPFASDLDKIEAVIENEDYEDPETPAGCFLDEVFGDESLLDYKTWAEKCCNGKKMGWIFNARDLRARIF